MARIILLIVLFWILYQIVKRIAAGATSKSEQTPEQTMVQCAHCGCHVPMSETKTKNNLIVCNNPECLKASSKAESTANKDAKN
jgi:ssDNA-binding Zn-finger/Zn-ribbon topoisomerase 1